MSTKRTNPSCRPGTTDAMQRLAEENEALRAARDELAARVERLNEAWSLFSDAVADINYCRGSDAGFICGDHADNQSMEKIHESRRGAISVMRLARSMIEETPTQSLAHIRAAGAREALERAMQSPGFSDTVVRVDLMREIIEQMEGKNV